MNINELDPFTRQYMETALWSYTDEDDNWRREAKEAGYEVHQEGNEDSFWFSGPGITHSEYYEYSHGSDGAWRAAWKHSGRAGAADTPLDANYDITKLAPATIEKMKADCKKFQEDNRELLEAAYADATLPVNGNGERMGGSSSAGHDFWLTRLGHGAGFWDGDWDSVANGGEEYGDRLTVAAKEFSEHIYLYVGEDGLIYQDGDQ